MAYTTIDNPELYFQTKLYAGNGSSQSITFDGSEDMQPDWVWIKSRTDTRKHNLYDVVRGANKRLVSNLDSAEDQPDNNAGVNAFNSNGFSLGDSTTVNNGDGGIYSSFVSWTFRKQPKFFDVVTYTCTSSAQAIRHNLGSVPGMIMVKCTNDTGNWRVYHSGLDGGNAPEDYVINLNLTNILTSRFSF